MFDASRPEAAARRHLEALGWVSGCVTPERLVAPTSHFVTDYPYRVGFPRHSVSLRAPSGGPRGLLFDVAIDAAIVAIQPGPKRRRWRVETRMYQYRLLDHNERELLVYHWQPGSAYLGPDHPHLHVSASLNAQITAIDRRSIDLDKVHLATGRVSLASVVRMLIAEFSTAPRRHDWAETLDRAEPMFQQETGPSA